MKLKDKLHSKEPHQDIRDWCLQSRIPAAQVVAEGLRYSQMQSPEAMEEAMTAKAIEEKGRMDWGLTVLGTMGNNAPFIGLLGTVIGIIQAFHQLASSDSAGPEVVMESVSEALVATGVGLFVAIPAVIAYNSYMRIMRKRMADCDASINFLLSYSRRIRNDNGK